MLTDDKRKNERDLPSIVIDFIELYAETRRVILKIDENTAT